MSDLYVKPRTATVQMTCDKCGKRWESGLYVPRKWGDEAEAAAPAFALGWTLYAAARGRRVYCPEHKPSTPMRLIHGRERV